MELAHPKSSIASQSQVVTVKLDDVVDSRNNDVPEHLGKIADSMYEWEGAVAENLKLTKADVTNITKKFPIEMNLQALVTMPKHIVTFNYFLQLIGEKHCTNGSRSWVVMQHIGIW